MKFMDKLSVPIAGAIMIATLVSVILGFEPARSSFCKPDDICLRDWLSALSGWAAVIAAYFTIRKMNEQQKESNRHQRENIELEVMGRLALAKRTRRAADRLRPSLARMRWAGLDAERNLRLPSSEEEHLLVMASQFLLENMKSELFMEYEEKLGFPPSFRIDMLTTCAEAIASCVNDFDQARTKSDLGLAFFALEQMRGFGGTASGLCETMIESADAVIGKWELRMNDHSAASTNS
ncbi:hypothetical protein EHI44_24210 [Rhizobium leguminosarum]|uniref:hypothetical protein n=1 Tax=Rhizobium leguminosarum TaxID=384 RepID=UPI000FEF10BF|nr:hypothetical protein [Rhizobium leguminosarum]RWY82397.1 hypothetical protein EHI44_24210 [Rhizobium leguminosarum]